MHTVRAVVVSYIDLVLIPLKESFISNLTLKLLSYVIASDFVGKNWYCSFRLILHKMARRHTAWGPYSHYTLIGTPRALSQGSPNFWKVPTYMFPAKTSQLLSSPN